MRFPRVLFWSLIPLLASCGSISNLKAKHAEKKQAKALEKAAKLVGEEKAKPPVTKAVGEVSYVDEESGFILIRQLPGQKIVPSTPLLSRGRAGVTSKLTSNPAAKGSFLVADIVSGQPQKGDAVFTDVDTKAAVAPPLMPIPPSATTPPGGTTENPAAAGPVPNRVPPKLDPILPPLDPLQPPSGEAEVPQLPQ